MIPVYWLGVVASIIALMFAGLHGDILMGLMACVTGWICWELLQDQIENSYDLDDWDDRWR